MIAYRSTMDKGRVTISSSTGSEVTTSDPARLLDFLYRQPKDDYKVAWDLDAFMAPILRRLPMQHLKCLFDTTRAWFDDWGFTYHIASKGSGASFTMVSNKITTQYYHLSQYYPDMDEPDDLSTIVKLGEDFVAKLKSVGITPNRLSSPASIIEVLLDKLPLPNWEHIPNEVGQLTMNASGRKWTEATAIGHWPTPIWDYDLRSAYPSVAASLLDCRPHYGDWTNQKERPQGAEYGVSYGTVKVNADLSPIVFTDAYDHLFNPTGTFDEILSLSQIDCLRDLDIGTFEPSAHTWWFVPRRRVRPLQNLVYRLYQIRQTVPQLERCMKLGLDAIYGKFGQMNRNKKGERVVMTRFTMPLWTHVIETSTNVEVMRFLAKHNVIDAVLHISTDGCLLSRPVPLPENQHPLPGTWKLDGSGPCLILSSGAVFHGKKRPMQLLYQEAIDLIKSAPKASEWSKPVKRRMTLGDVVADVGLQDLGMVKNVLTSINLKILDHDRYYPNLPFTGEALLNGTYPSRALDAKGLKPSREIIEGVL